MMGSSKSLKKIGLAIVLGIALVSASHVFAQSVGGGQGGSKVGGSQSLGSNVTLVNPLGQNCTTLSCPVTKVINFLYTIAVVLCSVMILVGGFQMITAAGDPEKFSKGRKTILYAAIGFVVVLVAGSVATLIQNLLGS